MAAFVHVHVHDHVNVHELRPRLTLGVNVDVDGFFIGLRIRCARSIRVLLKPERSLKDLSELL